jgi:hypothetical protein
MFLEELRNITDEYISRNISSYGSCVPQGNINPLCYSGNPEEHQNFLIFFASTYVPRFNTSETITLMQSYKDNMNKWNNYLLVT